MFQVKAWCHQTSIILNDVDQDPWWHHAVLVGHNESNKIEKEDILRKRTPRFYVKIKREPGLTDVIKTILIQVYKKFRSPAMLVDNVSGRGLMPPNNRHYLKECWPRSLMTPCGVSRPYRVKWNWERRTLWFCIKKNVILFSLMLSKRILIQVRKHFKSPAM